MFAPYSLWLTFLTLWLHVLQVGSILYDRGHLIVDADQSVHDLLYDRKGVAPLTTIAPGVVVNSALKTSKIAAAFPKGSPYAGAAHQVFLQLEQGATVFR